MTDNQEYFESEEFRSILNQYEEAGRTGHRVYIDADDLADIADYYQYHGRRDEADTAVSLALEYNPEAVGPLLYMARDALLKEDFATAWEYAERIHPVDNREALYLQGEIMICEGREEEADQLYREQMDEIPSDELTDYVYDVANIFSDYDLHDKAFEWMARSQGDDSDDFKELMARILFGLGKYQDSERLFNELIDHNPYSTRYWNALAYSQFMREDYGAAITSSEYAIAIDPEDAEGLLSKANCLYYMQDYEAALSYFNRYTKQVENDEAGYLYQGTCLINLGRYKEAAELLNEAERLAPANSDYLPEIYQELAFCHSEQHEPEAALYYLDQTRRLDCDHVNMEVVRGHILLANDMQEEAMNVFRNALQLSDESPKTMLRIIISLYDNQYIRTSYLLLKQFLKRMGNDWDEGYSYMVLCCMDMQKGDEFMHYLRLATEKNAKEARTVLGFLFPEGMAPEDYYCYMKEKINQT